MGCARGGRGGVCGFVGGIPMKYTTLRTIHLLCGALALPVLLMYGISAVQMANSKWFDLKPAVRETVVEAATDYADGRLMAREVMAAQNLRGEINAVQTTSAVVTSLALLRRPEDAPGLRRGREYLLRTMRAPTVPNASLTNTSHNLA